MPMRRGIRLRGAVFLPLKESILGFCLKRRLRLLPGWAFWGGLDGAEPGAALGQGTCTGARLAPRGEQEWGEGSSLQLHSATSIEIRFKHVLGRITLWNYMC